MMLKKIRIITTILILPFLFACATKKEEPSNAEDLYMRGYKQLSKSSFKRAGETFEKVEVQFPYSKWAIKSKIMAGYSYYLAKEYDDSIMALDRFIHYHPGNTDIAYAYYLKSIAYYDQINVVEKTQDTTLDAHNALNQVVLRFPDTKYADDAKNKLKLTFDYMAGQNMDVGRFYLQRKNYLSALNRFSTVVVEFQTTSYIAEALYRQVEIYTILGMNEEADNAYKVLTYNYPNSDWSVAASKIIVSENRKNSKVKK